MVDDVETDLLVQVACVTQGCALPEHVIGSLPFGFDRLFEGPSLNLGEDPMDTVEARDLVTCALDRVMMCWGHKRPDFVAQPVGFGRPIPANSMVRTTIGGARIG
jgi:hypothetical protein